ncbi:DUF2486 family protein [Paraburkholderia phymatum]|uniref:DUF2486 domain-containing protein n=1 Tax=Paraburkholderia phymatum (strain DSM 17167 / CIP 108236 / LMG 21445 / STM815) TaxID=391038 RepID=B2JET3_PARP8|nr:DUF2486 family protein [Paraburkholderia phymatum]ACC71398.1 conserved hypothetical protein [Paraburkholderia phymatum STM815]
MSQSSDPSDQDIPLLTDVMETGHDPHAKTKRPKRSGSHEHAGSHARKHRATHDGASAHEAADEAADEAAQEAARDEYDAPHESAPHPSPSPRVEAAAPPADDDDVPLLDSVYESPEVLSGRALQPEREAPQALAREPAQFVPGEAEFTSGSTAERYVPPPVADLAQAQAHHASTPAATTDYDADLLAERLRGRFATYLNGDGRNLIEARCRDAFQDHTTWLVNQITREVALALETEMLRWVREAIREELGNSATGK